MERRDIHVLKYFSTFVSVSNGQVINITEPTLMFCPLAKHLYKDFSGMRVNDKEAIKGAIKSSIESKIKEYGFFTDERKISRVDASIPYGASEMLSFALKKGVIDAAVVVCEGAGTVITDNPDVVQGIGARMNSLLLTSPINGIIERLKRSGSRVVFENALIDQVRGAKDAIEAGHKTIAVTVSGYSAQDLKILRLLEKEHGVRIISLAVCTTGVAIDKIALIGDCADLVWSCASFDVRQRIGPLAIIQLSKQIPVFVLTENGIDFISAYADENELIKRLDIRKQYLFSNEPSATFIHLGTFKVFISESKLPVNARKEPSFEHENEHVRV